MTDALSIAEVTTTLARFLSERWGEPVSVDGVEKIFGGASRETFRLNARRRGGSQGLILRRDPPSSLIDTERKLEYGAYCAIYPTGIPVPEPLFLEDDPSWLGQPFSIMAEIAGAKTDVSTLDKAEREQLGREKWTLLGRLATLDPVALGFPALTKLPLADECALRELDYWAGVIESDQMEPQPIASAAIRWLRRNLPPPARAVCVVHGDYRTGNFLYVPGVGIKGILDWEMCHLGDPLEDLAWSLDPLWCWGEPTLAGRLLPVNEAIAAWSAASGFEVDEQAFRWWRIFASLKALAIWISSCEDFHRGASKDAILAYAGWVMSARQNRILLDYLNPEPSL
ncbi:MAG: phosphotransferase family protein [Pseudomonadota bacterium]